jgi:RHS repeat-associated protein
VTPIFSAAENTTNGVQNGLVREFTYTNHWVASETWRTNDQFVARWDYAYDGAGNRTYARDPLGAATHAVYENNLPVVVTNALRQITRMQYDGHGNLMRQINPRSATTRWAYDSRGLCTNTVLADETSYSMSYDSIGRLTGVADPVGFTISNVYDNLDRVTDVWYPGNSHTHYNFSCCGLDSVVDRLERQTTYQRDLLKRVTNVVDAANQRVSFGYNAGDQITNLTVWVNGLPRTTYFSYTSTNGYTRLTQRKSPLGKTTGYDYYFRGWLKSRTDGASRVTQYQYDGLGRLKQINYPGNTNVTMGYDAVGHVTSLANNNASGTFAYDVLGRLTSTTVGLDVPGMTAVSYRLEYQYDSAGNVTNRTQRGLSGFTQVIPTRYDYDLMNRLTLVTNALAKANYSYDKGRLVTKLYGNGDWVSYQYDLESRLTNLAIWAGTMLQRFGYTYDAMGMMRSQESKSLLGAGYSEQRIDYGYDAVYQLTSEVVRVNNGAAVTNAWTYDAAGNVRTASGKFGSAQATVNADNELISWTQTATQVTVTGLVEPGPRSNKWFASTATARGHSAPVSMQDGSFGIVGVPVNAGANVLTAMVQDVSGNSATNIVNFTVGNSQISTFSYDPNGNLSSVSSASSVLNYGYDAENRLTTVTSNSVTVLECWYDGAGHRIAKREIINGQTNTWQYVWDGWNLIAVLGADGSLKEFYTRGVGIAGDIGTLVAVTHYTGGSPNATCHLHNNHRGDVIMARQGTNTVATLEYAPYGEIRTKTGSYTPRFRFSSKEYDTATGFYHFPYRFYAPQWARWASRDPIAEHGGLNLYRYVLSNPIRRVDPKGRQFYEPPLDMPPGTDIGSGIVSMAGCVRAIIDAYRTTRRESGPMAHCVTSCKLARACGSSISRFLGVAKEYLDLWGYFLGIGGCGISDDEFNDTVEDLTNDAIGIDCAGDSGSCESCCGGASLVRL